MAKVEFTKMMALETLAKLEEVKTDERLINFVTHEMELLLRKKAYKSNKPSKRQEENAKVLVPAIMAFLETVDRATASQIADGIEVNIEVTTPRVTAQLTKLKNAKEITNLKEKGTSYYFIEK